MIQGDAHGFQLFFLITLFIYLKKNIKEMNDQIEYISVETRSCRPPEYYTLFTVMNPYISQPYLVQNTQSKDMWELFKYLPSTKKLSLIQVPNPRRLHCFILF